MNLKQALQCGKLKQFAKEHERYFFRNSTSMPSSCVSLDQDADVVADELAQHLVGHRHGRLAAHVIAELRLRSRLNGPLIKQGGSLVHQRWACAFSNTRWTISGSRATTVR